MKKTLIPIFSLIFLVSINATTSYATVYQPNTDIPVEEITTPSSPTITTRAANPEGSWKKVGGGNILMAVMPQIHGYKSIITGTISTMMVICLLDGDISIMNGTI